MGKEERLRIKAEWEENLGKKHESREFFILAKINYERAKRLREQAGDTESAESLQRSIERVEESWKWQKELKSRAS